MMILNKILIMSLIFSITGNNAFGEVPSPSVIIVNEGDRVPFDGYLFPPDKAILMKKELMELDELRQLADSYQKSIDDYKKNEDLYTFKVNALLNENDKLSNAMYKQEDRSKWEQRMWFVAGIFVT